MVIKMKSFVISIILAACIIGGGIWYAAYLEDFSDKLLEQNEEIRLLLSKEKYADAREAEEELSRAWESGKNALASTLDHGNIDDIEKSLAEIKAYTDEGAKADTLAKCEVLRIMLEHLPNSCSFKLENIL